MSHKERLVKLLFSLCPNLFENLNTGQTPCHRRKKLELKFKAVKDSVENYTSRRTKSHSTEQPNRGKRIRAERKGGVDGVNGHAERTKKT